MYYKLETKEIVRNPKNFKLADKEFISDISKADKEILKKHKIYKYVRYIPKAEETVLEVTLDFNEELMEVTEVPKLKVATLKELKEKRVEDLKEHANNILKKTDWAVIRKLETGKEIPEDIQAKRKKVKDKVTELENKIKKARKISILVLDKTGLEDLDA